MSNQPQLNNTSDEIDLREVFNLIGNFFKKVLRLIFKAVDFYKQKWMLFVGLFVVGLGLGYVIDYVILDNPTSYKQEVIVEPNFGSVSYFYDNVKELVEAVDRKNPIPEVNITQEQWDNIKEIKVTPIINTSDFLSNINNDAAKAILGDNLKSIDDKILNDPAYVQFYSKHKLIVEFKDSTNAEEITVNLLEYLKDSEYYKELGQIRAENLKYRIEQNKKSIALIDSYLESLNKESDIALSARKEFTLYSEGQEPDVANIILQKTSLLEEQQRLEENLKIKNEVLKVVKKDEVALVKKRLLKKKVIQAPLFLIIAVSVFFFLKYLFSTAREFANS